MRKKARAKRGLFRADKKRNERKHTHVTASEPGAASVEDAKDRRCRDQQLVALEGLAVDEGEAARQLAQRRAAADPGTRRSRADKAAVQRHGRTVFSGFAEHVVSTDGV